MYTVYHYLFLVCELEVLIYLPLAALEGMPPWLTQMSPTTMCFYKHRHNCMLSDNCLRYLHLNEGKSRMGGLEKRNVYSPHWGRSTREEMDWEKQREQGVEWRLSVLKDQENGSFEKKKDIKIIRSLKMIKWAALLELADTDTPLSWKRQQDRLFKKKKAPCLKILWL